MPCTRRVTVLAFLALAALPPLAFARSALPNRAWIKRADTICARTDEAVRSLRQPQVNPANPPRRDLPAIARYLRRLAPLLAHEVDSIAALPPPAHNAQTARRFIAAASLSVAALRVSAGEAARRDLDRYRRSFLRDNRDGTRASAMAKRFGLTVCGQ